MAGLEDESPSAVYHDQQYERKQTVSVRMFVDQLNLTQVSILALARLQDTLALNPAHHPRR